MKLAYVTFLKKFVFALVYIVGSFVFYVIFSEIIHDLNSMGMRQAESIYVILSFSLFTAVISIIFSFEYIKELFRKKTKLQLNIAPLIVTLLTLVTFYLLFNVHHENWPYHGILIRVLVTYTRTLFGQVILFLMFWYNLIRTFSRTP